MFLFEVPLRSRLLKAINRICITATLTLLLTLSFSPTSFAAVDGELAADFILYDNLEICGNLDQPSGLAVTYNDQQHPLNGATIPVDTNVLFELNDPLPGGCFSTFNDFYSETIFQDPETYPNPVFETYHTLERIEPYDMVADDTGDTFNYIFPNQSAQYRLSYVYTITSGEDLLLSVSTDQGYVFEVEGSLEIPNFTIDSMDFLQSVPTTSFTVTEFNGLVVNYYVHAPRYIKKLLSNVFEDDEALRNSVKFYYILKSYTPLGDLEETFDPVEYFYNEGQQFEIESAGYYSLSLRAVDNNDQDNFKDSPEVFFRIVNFDFPEIFYQPAPAADLVDLDDSEYCFGFNYNNVYTLPEGATVKLNYATNQTEGFVTLAQFDATYGDLCIDLAQSYNKFAPTILIEPFLEIITGQLYTEEYPLQGNTIVGITRTLETGVNYFAPDSIDLKVTGNTTFDINLNDQIADKDNWSIGKLTLDADTGEATFKAYNPEQKAFQDCDADKIGVYQCLGSPTVDLSSIILVDDAAADFFTQASSYDNSYFLFKQNGDELDVVQFTVVPTYVFLTNADATSLVNQITVGSPNYVLFRDPTQSYNAQPEQTAVATIGGIEVELTEVGDTGVYRGQSNLAGLAAGNTTITVDTNSSTTSTPILAKYSTNPYYFSGGLQDDPDTKVQSAGSMSVVPEDADFSPYYYQSQTNGINDPSQFTFKFGGNQNFFCSEPVLGGTNRGISFLTYIQDTTKIFAGMGDGPPGKFGFEQNFNPEVGLQSDEDLLPCQKIQAVGGGMLGGNTGLTAQFKDLGGTPDRLGDQQKTFKYSTALGFLNGWNRVKASPAQITYTPFGMGAPEALNPNEIFDWEFSLATELVQGEDFAFGLTDVLFNYLAEPVELTSTYNAVIPAPANPPSTGGTISSGSNPSNPNNPGTLAAEFSMFPRSLNLNGVERVCTSTSNLSTGNFTTSTWKVFKGTEQLVTQNGRNVTLCFISTGTYTVELTVSGLSGTDTERKVNYISVINIPTTPPTPGGNLTPQTPTSPDDDSDDATDSEGGSEGGSDTPDDQLEPEEDFGLDLPSDTSSSDDSERDAQKEQNFRSCLDATALYPNINPLLDTDKDGVADIFELSFGTDPNQANPLDVAKFLSGNCQNLGSPSSPTTPEIPAIPTDEDEFMVLNFKVQTPTISNLLIPGTVYSSDEFDSVCLSLSGRLSFELGCTSLEKINGTNQANFSYFSEKNLPDGQYTVTATATNSAGKRLSDSRTFNKVSSTFPVTLVDFNGLDPATFKSRQADPADPNSAVILTAPRLKDAKNLYATFFAPALSPEQYVLEAYWNSVVLSSAALSDTTTGYTTVAAPQWFELGSADAHRLVVNAYSLADPTVLSQTLIIEFGSERSALFWLILLSAAAAILLSIAYYYRKRTSTIENLEPLPATGFTPNPNQTSTVTPNNPSDQAINNFFNN